MLVCKNGFVMGHNLMSFRSCICPSYYFTVRFQSDSNSLVLFAGWHHCNADRCLGGC